MAIATDHKQAVAYGRQRLPLTEGYAVHRTDKLNTAYSFADGLGGPIDKCAYRPN